MKKWLSATLIVLLLFLLFSPLETNANYDTNSAKAYLSAHSGNPWSTMALAALESPSISMAYLASVSGTNAIDYAAPILAITAMGQNPRTFASTDYIAALKSYNVENQIGNSSALNDDFFGILALVSAGESLADPVVVNSKNFILSHQNSDGGWGFTITSNSDTNMTAAAVLALLAAGVDRGNSQIQNALSFLQTSQNDDGGFPYYLSAVSDSSSTAWVIWALNALNISSNSLVKSGHTPISYLESNQSSQGFFKFQSDSGEDAFSAVTTAYAVLALQGKKLPLRVAADDALAKKFPFRIEGSEKTICLGEAAGPTALDIIKNTKSFCGFTYEIEDTSWGPYLKKINTDQAAGMTGWLYLVNNFSPSVGAADYKLQAGDSVLWYYGDFGWPPTRLILPSDQTDAGQSITATIESFSDGLWSPLAKASVYFNTAAAITDDNGQAVVALQNGFYKVYAQKQGYIRSNSILLKVGQPASSSVGLSVTVEQKNTEGGDNAEDVISFTVDPSSLDFGKLNPGSSAAKNITLSNNGTADIDVKALVNGDSLFTENLDLNSIFWKNFEANIAKSDGRNVEVKLSIPAGYSDGSGAKSAQLTFWAIARR